MSDLGFDDLDPFSAADQADDLDPFAAADAPVDAAAVDEGFGPAPSPTERPDLYGPAPPVPPAAGEVPEMPGGVLGAALVGGLQGLTLGHGDELTATLSGVPGSFEYEQERDRLRRADELYAEDSPIAYGGGQLAGALAPLLLTGGAAAPAGGASAGGTLARIGANARAALQSLRGAPAGIAGAAAEGLGYGALAGEGYSDAPLLSEDTARDVVLGGAAGAATGGLGEAIYRTSRPLAMGLGAAGLGGAAWDVATGTPGLGTAIGAGMAALGLRSGRKPAVEAAGRGVQGAGRSVLPNWISDVQTPLLPPEEMSPEAAEGVDWEAFAPLAGGAATAMMLPPPTPQALAIGEQRVPSMRVPDAAGITAEGADLVRRWEEEEARAAEHLADYQSGLSPEDAAALRDLESQRERVAAESSGRRARFRTPSGGVLSGPRTEVLADLDVEIDRIRSRAKPASGRRPRRPADLASMFLIGAAGTELGRRLLPDWLGGEGGETRESGIRPLARVEPEGPRYDHVSPQLIDPSEIPLGPEPDFTLPPSPPRDERNVIESPPISITPDVRGIERAGPYSSMEPVLPGVEFGEAELELPAMDVTPRHVSPALPADMRAPLGPEPGFVSPNVQARALAELERGSVIEAAPTYIRPEGREPRFVGMGPAELELPAMDVTPRPMRVDFGEAQIEPRREVEFGEAQIEDTYQEPGPAREARAIELALQHRPESLGPWQKAFTTAQRRDPERGVAVAMEKLQQSDPAFRAWISQDRSRLP